MLKIKGSVSFEDTKNSNQFLELRLAPFFTELTAKTKKCSYFIWDKAMAYITNFSMA
jgi:hypothetical protein